MCQNASAYRQHFGAWGSMGLLVVQFYCSAWALPEQHKESTGRYLYVVVCHPHHLTSVPRHTTPRQPSGRVHCNPLTDYRSNSIGGRR